MIRRFLPAVNCAPAISSNGTSSPKPTRLPTDATRLGSIGECLPQEMILRRGRQDRVALTAKGPVAFGLREQRAHFRVAAGGQQGRSIEGAGQGALLNEFA